MLKSKTFFFINMLSMGLLVTSVILMIQEGEHYTGSEKLWEQQSWDFWQ